VDAPSPFDRGGGSRDTDQLIRLVVSPTPAPREHKPKPKPAGIITSVAGVLMVLTIGYGLFRFATAYGVGYERSRLAARVTEISHRIDPGTIEKLTGTAGDADTPAFRHIVGELTQVHSENRDCRFTYLMGRKDGAVIFLVDSTDPSSPDYSPPGEVYEEASPALIASFDKGESFVEGPTVDRWGTWVSGLAPIRDHSTGRVVGVLGMDVSAERWRITEALARILATLGTGLLAWAMYMVAKRARE
jgi:hypothetical protein